MDGRAWVMGGGGGWASEPWARTLVACQLELPRAMAVSRRQREGQVVGPSVASPRVSVSLLHDLVFTVPPINRRATAFLLSPVADCSRLPVPVQRHPRRIPPTYPRRSMTLDAAVHGTPQPQLAS